LLGIQLFLIGVVIVALSLLVEKLRRLPALGGLLRSAFAAVLFFEGIALMILATPIDVNGIGGMLERTVMIGGLQLAFVGLFTLAFCALSTNPTNRRVRKLALLSAVFLAFLLPLAAMSAGSAL
jgi:hypothetical protein